MDVNGIKTAKIAQDQDTFTQSGNTVLEELARVFHMKQTAVMVWLHLECLTIFDPLQNPTKQGGTSTMRVDSYLQLKKGINLLLR